EYAARAGEMPPGRWRDRFFYALRSSLEVLHHHRGTLAALVSVLIGDADEGLFAPGTSFSRVRVQCVFREAVVGASDAPSRQVGPALGRLLYVAHLATILWWLLDRTPGQWATDRLVELMERVLLLAALSFNVPRVRALIVDVDGLVRAALFDDKADEEDR